MLRRKQGSTNLQPMYSRARESGEISGNAVPSSGNGTAPIDANASTSGHDPFEFEDDESPAIASAVSGQMKLISSSDPVMIVFDSQEQNSRERNMGFDYSEVDFSSDDNSEDSVQAFTGPGRGRGSARNIGDASTPIFMNLMPTRSPFAKVTYGVLHGNGVPEFQFRETAVGFVDPLGDGNEPSNHRLTASEHEAEIKVEAETGQNAHESHSLDCQSEIFWSTEPPSAENEQSYKLPCSAPDKIELSPTVAHLLNETNNPAAFFNAVFTDDVLNEIVACTNSYGEYEIGEKWKPIDVVELRAFLGAMIYIGESGMGSWTWDELFKVSSYRVNLPLIRAFGRDRFKLINRFLRFNDQHHSTADNAANRIQKIEGVFNYIITKCREMFVPSKWITIGESMIDNRRGVHFKMNCPTKSDSSSMKIAVVCDISGLILNAQVCGGKLGNEAEDIVRGLVSPYAGSGRVVGTGRSYTDIELARQLFEEDGLLTFGTIQPNRKGIPPEFRDLNMHEHYELAPQGLVNRKRKYSETVDDAPDPQSDHDNHTSNSERGATSLRRGRGRPRGRHPSRSRFINAGYTAHEIAARAKRERLEKIDIAIEECIATNFVGSARVGVPDSCVRNVMAEIRRGMDPAPATKVRVDIPQSAFMFSDYITLVKYEPAADKQVHMLSTLHHLPLVMLDKEATPSPVLDFNRVKNGIGFLDHMAKTFSTVAGCRRWPMRLFAWLVDAACVAASTAHKLALGEELNLGDRRFFLQTLATALMKPAIRRREKDRGSRMHMRNLKKIALAVLLAQKVTYPLLDEPIRLKQVVDSAVGGRTKTSVKTLRPPRDLSKISRTNRPGCYVCKKKTSRVCRNCRNPTCTDHSYMRMFDNEKRYFCNDLPGVYCTRNQ